jgi:uncharacterized protein (DUF2235 family)
MQTPYLDVSILEPEEDGRKCQTHQALQECPQKRLALFLDGTWNTVDDNTNVWRLKCLCAARDAEDVNQLVYYDAGLGTQFGEKIRGGVFGSGLGKNLKDAYEWLIDNYNPGDDIFIFEK